MSGTNRSAGAFGGMGGQSAFGTKAGDMFTKITIGVAAFWILLCVVTVKYFGGRQDLVNPNLGGPPIDGAQAAPGAEAGAEGTPVPEEIPATPAEDPPS